MCTSNTISQIYNSWKLLIYVALIINLITVSTWVSALFVSNTKHKFTSFTIYKESLIMSNIGCILTYISIIHQIHYIVLCILYIVSTVSVNIIVLYTCDTFLQTHIIPEHLSIWSNYCGSSIIGFCVLVLCNTIILSFVSILGIKLNMRPVSYTILS